MKTISQAMGNSVYAIVRRAGALPQQERRRQVGETACERQYDEPRAKGRDRRGRFMRHGDERYWPKSDLQGTSPGLRRNRKRRDQCVRDDADSDRAEQE